MSTSSVTGSNVWSGILANSATSTAASSASAAAAASGSSASASQDLAQTFLTLLVAQMNNQDPLNPVDNSQLTQQMAQISTVTGINNLNSSVQSLLSQMQQSSTIQSAQLTGQSVMVAGSGLNLATNTNAASGVSAVGGYSLASAASNVTVTVKNASGQTVNTLALGAQNAGFQDFSWDGSTSSGSTAAAGSYTFSVAATSSTGAPVTATPYNAQQVVGAVPQSNGSTQLMLGNGTQVPYSSIAQIF